MSYGLHRDDKNMTALTLFGAVIINLAIGGVFFSARSGERPRPAMGAADMGQAATQEYAPAVE